MSARRVVVIGGGAAGLVAAGEAARAGAAVTLCEKMPRPARKLAITGEGRCNLTNIAPVPESIAHFNPGGVLLRRNQASCAWRDPRRHAALLLI